MILNNGLVEIRKFAFYECKSLVCVDVPPNVRAIKKGAFYGCLGLTIGILSDGLEEIGEYAFAYCQSLVRINVPFNVRVIKEGAVCGCTRLTTAILGERLEEVGKYLCIFRHVPRTHQHTPQRQDDSCKSLQDCSDLTTIKFCSEIKEFMSWDSMWDWWNNGIH